MRVTHSKYPNNALDEYKTWTDVFNRENKQEMGTRNETSTIEADTYDSRNVCRHWLHQGPGRVSTGGGACTCPAAGGRPGSDPRRRLVTQPAGVQARRA